LNPIRIWAQLPEKYRTAVRVALSLAAFQQVLYWAFVVRLEPYLVRIVDVEFFLSFTSGLVLSSAYAAAATAICLAIVNALVVLIPVRAYKRRVVRSVRRLVVHNWTLRIGVFAVFYGAFFLNFALLKSMAFGLLAGVVPSYLTSRWRNLRDRRRDTRLAAIEFEAEKALRGLDSLSVEERQLLAERLEVQRQALLQELKVSRRRLRQSERESIFLGGLLIALLFIESFLIGAAHADSLTQGQIVGVDPGNFRGVIVGRTDDLLLLYLPADERVIGVSLGQISIVPVP
jgi:hypothetical protein